MLIDTLKNLVFKPVRQKRFYFTANRGSSIQICCGHEPLKKINAAIKAGPDAVLKLNTSNNCIGIFESFPGQNQRVPRCPECEYLFSQISIKERQERLKKASQL